ncbi:MAG: hypothetical protein Q9169_007947, partial [Polycauliona sp. 2 TL-2023]
MFASFALTALVATTSTVSATRLYVSSYNGNITTFNFAKTSNATYNLTRLDMTTGCALNPSWLQIDDKNHNLFCLDENFPSAINASIVSFKINSDKAGGPSLKKVTNTTVPAAPVNSALYTGSNGTQLLAVAHYIHALTTYTVDSRTATFALSQSFNFTSTPGPKPQQAVARPHQVVIDPQKRYLV